MISISIILQQFKKLEKASFFDSKLNYFINLKLRRLRAEGTGDFRLSPFSFPLRTPIFITP
ncbi:hypothetical protein HMPREF3224_02131 [Anaerococcus hydrogenalis]|nr:hypothetical protein HMPREF3224_02131 [Anaerococcus hydrogenalis]